MRKATVLALALSASAGMIAGPQLATAASSAGSAPAPAQSSTADSLQVIGLAGFGSRLVAFQTSGSDSRSIGAIQGLDGDGRILGIDYRVADGKLYALGNNGGIYTLNTDTARATKFGRLTERLEGSQFGVDVNPAADALRIVSNTGQNLRHSFSTPNGPTTTDTRLTTPPTEGDTTGVTGVAYTNNDTSADTFTTLYAINRDADQVAVLAPANSGTLSPTGNLRSNAIGSVGFDIYSVVRGGETVALDAYASLNVGGDRRLYSIRLSSGRATVARGLEDSVTDIALPLNQR